MVWSVQFSLLGLSQGATTVPELGPPSEQGLNARWRVWLCEPKEGMLFHCILPHPLGGRRFSTRQIHLSHSGCVVHGFRGTVLDTKLPPLVRDLDNVGPGEEEDFRLVTVDGNTTIRGTDQNKGVRERERERERERGPTYQPAPEDIFLMSKAK